MTNRLHDVLTSIQDDYGAQVRKGSRHYREVSVGRQAAKLGYDDLRRRFSGVYAIVPLKVPREGMKVRIDGRTFVDYAEDETGIAYPGYIVREAGRRFKSFIPNDSMICNFC